MSETSAINFTGKFTSHDEDENKICNIFPYEGHIVSNIDNENKP